MADVVIVDEDTVERFCMSFHDGDLGKWVVREHISGALGVWAQCFAHKACECLRIDHPDKLKDPPLGRDGGGCIDEIVARNNLERLGA